MKKNVYVKWRQPLTNLPYEYILPQSIQKVVVHVLANRDFITGIPCVKIFAILHCHHMTIYAENVCACRMVCTEVVDCIDISL